MKKTNSVRINGNSEKDTDKYQSEPVSGNEQPDMHNDKPHEDKVTENESNFFNKGIEKLDELAIKARIVFNLSKQIPFILLGDRIKNQGGRYESLQVKLRQARIPISYEMYISNAIFYSALSALVGALSGIFLAYTLIYLIGIPENITNLAFGPSTAWILEYRDIIIAFFMVIALTVIFTGIIYTLFMMYPAFLAGERKTKIDTQIPYAVTFMYSQSKGGMNIIEVFRELAKSERTYGEVSKEVDTIIRDTDYFGHDLRTAIKNSIEVTPSARFQDLMYNLLTVIDAGGSIPRYFQDKSEQYLQQSSNDQKGFLETLGLLAESYVTAFVAGPLFIIIVGVMMAVMGSGTQVMIYALIYAILPIGSLMFIVMISIMTPGEEGEPSLLETSKTEYENDHLTGKDYEEEKRYAENSEKYLEETEQIERFEKSKKMLYLRSLIRNPLKPMLERPMISLALTLPVAFLIIAVPLAINAEHLYTTSDMVTFLDDKIVLAAYITIVPLAVFHEIKSRRMKKFEKNLPDFLKKLASANETGMTLKDSINMIVKSNPKSMGGEINSIWNDIVWGISINDAMIRFANRTKTRLVARSVTLITKAVESSSDIGEVLMVAARDASSEQSMKDERSMGMMIYIVIIYIAFFVFVGVIYVVSTTFLAEMAAAGEKMAATGNQAGFLGTFDLDSYIQLFKHAAIIQGFSSGLMAGAMGEGSVMSGLKHAIVMMTIGYLLFTMFM